ncbi:hypothetical protein JL2886_03628 [Phaeobacter gallaeciensis]|uniref:Uncharacterized protein n=1 Tax=Phaeobacter gallaeciensis TaxID=60890 RepID=A0A1B0ZWW6_9RHOB|nr:hypothetical protein JL2886_03628 [Phaeobacter gallaeciensis]
MNATSAVVPAASPRGGSGAFTIRNPEFREETDDTFRV